MILWPTQIRRACLCPRLMVDEYRSKKSLWLVQGKCLLCGSFFHDSVAAPMFQAIASGRDKQLPRVLGDSDSSSSVLHEALWAHLDRKYLNAALIHKKRPISLTSEDVISLAQGLGKLAEFLVEIVENQKPSFASTHDLIKSLFLPPERPMAKSIRTSKGIRVNIRGKYDALLFDATTPEFIVLEFKCKGAHELVGDVEQVATYAWMIHASSGIPARASILYLDQNPDIKHLSSEDLSRGFPTSQRLIEEIAQWLSATDLRHAAIPPTTVDGLCEVCPLNFRCEEDFGPKEPSLADQSRIRVGTGRVEQQPPDHHEAIFLGRELGHEFSSVCWNPFGGPPALPNSHMLIVGTSGSGKTQILKALIAELTQRNIVPLILDFNNDYVQPNFLKEHRLRTHDPCDGLPLNPLELVPDVLSGKIRLMSTVFAAAGIFKRIYNLGPLQEANLRTAMEECFREQGITRETTESQGLHAPAFVELEEKIRELPNHVSLLNRLSPIFSLKLFTQGPDDETFAEFLSMGTIIRLASLPTEEVKLAVSEFLLLKLYNFLVAREHRESPHMAIVIDEAHKMSTSEAVVKLFREIRKFGVAMILSSQKAKDFHPDIHANAGSALFLKNTEINDRKYIADQLKTSVPQKEEIVSILGEQKTFEGLFRNDHYYPWVRLRIVPYFERLCPESSSK